MGVVCWRGIEMKIIVVEIKGYEVKVVEQFGYLNIDIIQKEDQGLCCKVFNGYEK